MKLFLDTLLTRKPDINEKHAIFIFEMLKQNYDNQKRYYHNWDHIQACLYEFEMAFSEIALEDLFIVIMAIYYHDYFYDVQSYVNEELSAKRALIDLLSLGFCEEEILPIYDLILLTTHNNISEEYNGKIIQDIDLSIFGKSYPQFYEYEKGIRKEFLYVPDINYYFNRIRFLKRIIKRKSIYQTEIFNELYEKTARENIVDLINEYIKQIKSHSSHYNYMTFFSPQDFEE